MERNREAALKRRIRCTQLHINCLQQIATDPTSCDAEITRRYKLIEAAEESIKLHEEAIQKIEEQRANVHDLITAAEARLRSLKKVLKRENSIALIKKLLIERARIAKELRNVNLDTEARGNSSHQSGGRATDNSDGDGCEKRQESQDRLLSSPEHTDSS